MARRLARAALLLLLCAPLWLAPAALAQEVRTYRKSATFEDVKLDLADAIISRGLVADFTGNVGAMLERTAKDVGSAKPIYKRAEYVSFCSAVLSRKLMEADPANLGYCPFVLFVYEAAAKPGEVVVGFRRLAATGDAASQKAIVEVEALLDGIARDALK